MFVCYTTSNCCFLHWKRMWYSSQLWSHGDLNMNIQSRSHVDRDQKEDSWCLQHLHEESTYKQWSYIINLIKITHDKASTNVRAFAFLATSSSVKKQLPLSPCIFNYLWLIKLTQKNIITTCRLKNHVIFSFHWFVLLYYLRRIG